MAKVSTQLLPRDPHPPIVAMGGSVARRAHLRSVPCQPRIDADTNQGPTPSRLHRLGVPLAGSIAAHGLLFIAIAVLVGGNVGGTRGFTPESRFTATLAAPPQRFVVPDEPKPIDPPAAAPVPAQPASGIVRTAKKRSTAQYAGSASGQSSILPLDEGTPAEGWLVAYTRDVYPGVPRTAAEFEVPPESVYPAAAVKDRRQAAFTVPVVLKSDGSVELMPKTFMDSTFAPAIVASLVKARVAASGETDAEVKPVGWALLTYMFEFTGEK